MKTNLSTIDSFPNLDDTAMALTRQRYQRISAIYDRMEGLMGMFKLIFASPIH